MCLKDQPCHVIKMREMRGEVEKKTPKKRWIVPHFYDVKWLIFETLCSVTSYWPTIDQLKYVSQIRRVQRKINRKCSKLPRSISL